MSLAAEEGEKREREKTQLVLATLQGCKLMPSRVGPGGILFNIAHIDLQFVID